MLLKINQKLFKKSIIIAIACGIGLIAVGCNSEKKYIDAGLTQLEEKYGEEFKVDTLSSSVGATRDTFKMQCYPIYDETKVFDVEVDNNYKLYGDGYMGLIMDEKLEDKLHDVTSSVFGKEVMIKAHIDGYITKYSKDMDILEYLDINSSRSFVLDIFINSDGLINKEEESKIVYEYSQALINLGIKNKIFIDFFYLNKNAYNNVENIYHSKYISGTTKFYDYYTSSDRSYADVYTEIEDGKSMYTVEEIQSKFSIHLN